MKVSSRCSASICVGVALLLVMGGLLVYRAQTDTTIVDESPHLVAGYSYVAKRDYRLNPEHPPLIKMAAGFPLLFQKVNFPDTDPSWTQDINGQWAAGDLFLHWVGNDPVKLMAWGRLGPIAITLLLGLLLFLWTRKLYGAGAAVFTLTLFVFSPTFLAHGAYVTTDVGASFAFLLATLFFFRYLNKQTRKNLILAGVAFGIAQLMKFSLILLIPYFVAIAILWVLFKDRPLQLFSWYTLSRLFRYFGKLLLIGIVGLAVVYPVYQYTVLDYPLERQVHDTAFTLRSSPWPLLAHGVKWMSDKPILRAYSQFFLGHLMVFQRVSGGNTVYYLGDVSSTAWRSYFPVVFLMKEPTAIILFILIAGGVFLRLLKKKMLLGLRGLPALRDRGKKAWHLFSEFMSDYFIEVAFFLFILLYWVTSILGNLNIGIRHVLPTFPFLYLLVASILSRWVKTGVREDLAHLKPLERLRVIFAFFISKWLKSSVLVVLMLWYIMSSLSVYPHSLAYFNELTGGPENGYKYVVDSNLDWGQDLRRLAKFVEKNNIEKIRLDSFGGGNPAYYLGSRYEKLNPFDENQRKGWIAVSGTLLQGGRGRATKGYDQSTTHYRWLDAYTPTTVIGHSIFVYHLPE